MPPGVRTAVVMATWNGSLFVETQLRSICEQSRPPHEIIIVDDASTDGTPAIVAGIARDYPSIDFDISVSRERSGVVGTFNRGFARASGDLVVLSDQDDLWHSDRLECVLIAFERDPSAMAVASDAQLIDASGTSLDTTHWKSIGFTGRWRREFEESAFRSLVRTNPLTGNCCAFRSEVLRMALPIPPGAIHEYWLLLFASIVGDIVLIDRPLVEYRQHSANTIGTGTRALKDALQKLLLPSRAAWSEEALFEHLLERFRAIDAARVEHIAALQGKTAFLRRRQALPVRRAARAREVGSLLLMGAYRKHARGMRSALADLAVAPHQRRSLGSPGCP